MTTHMRVWNHRLTHKGHACGGPGHCRGPAPAPPAERVGQRPPADRAAVPAAGATRGRAELHTRETAHHEAVGAAERLPRRLFACPRPLLCSLPLAHSLLWVDRTIGERNYTGLDCLPAQLMKLTACRSDRAPAHAPRPASVPLARSRPCVDRFTGNVDMAVSSRPPTCPPATLTRHSPTSRLSVRVAPSLGCRRGALDFL